MIARCCSLLAFLVVIAAPAPVRSADADAKSPTLTIRLRSIDRLIADAMFLASQAGKEEEAKQIDGFVKAKIGGKGLEGIDTQRPLGAYSILSADVVGSTTVVLVPIASEKAFLALLENLGQVAKRDKEGIYTVMPEQLPLAIHFRFANRYLYITAPDKSVLAKGKLLDPESVLPADDSTTLSATWNIDQVPAELKQIALSQMDLKFTDEQEKNKPGESDAEKQLRVQALKDISQQIASVINEGGQLGVRLGVNHQAKELAAEATLTGKTKSKLAKSISQLGSSPSLFGSLLASEAAMNLLVHLSLPEGARKALGPVIDQGIAKALEAETDEAKRAAAEKLLTVLKPTLKSGEIDAGFRVTGPNADNLYTILAGMKVQEGAALDKAIRNLVKGLPEREQKLIRFDAEKTTDASIHRLDAQKTFDAEARRTLGDHPVYVAILPEAIWVSAGPNGLSVIQEAVGTKPQAGPQFHFEMSVARLVPTLGKGDKAAQQRFSKIAKEVFSTGGNDKVVVSVSGGKALRARVTLRAELIRFLVLSTAK